MRQRGTFTKNGKKGKSSKLLIKFGNDQNLVTGTRMSPHMDDVCLHFR